MHLIYLLGLLVPCPPSRRKPGACSRWVEMLQLLPVRGASEPAPPAPQNTSPHCAGLWPVPSDTSCAGGEPRLH